MPCDWSLTVSLSGQRVAAMRRRRSTSCSSGMPAWNGQIVVSWLTVPAGAGCAAGDIGGQPTASMIADVPRSIAAGGVRKDIVILAGGRNKPRVTGATPTKIGDRKRPSGGLGPAHDFNAGHQDTPLSRGDKRRDIATASPISLVCNRAPGANGRWDTGKPPSRPADLEGTRPRLIASTTSCFSARQLGPLDPGRGHPGRTRQEPVPCLQCRKPAARRHQSLRAQPPAQHGP